METALKEYFTERFASPVEIGKLFRMSGGACQDNFWLDLKVKQGDFAGEHELVLRTDKAASIESSLTRRQEFRVAALAHQAGALTPNPRWFEANQDILGHPFYCMERIQGNADARYIVKDRGLKNTRAQVLGDLAANLARIHSVKREDHADFEFLDTGSDMTAENYTNRITTRLRNMLRELNATAPAAEMVLNWLDEQDARPEEFVLVHGDFRTGNYMVDESGLRGIVDWEFAHWGDGHEDLAWFCMRDWRFGKLRLGAGGIGERTALYEAYGRASGRPVDPARVTFWEIVGNIKWAIGARRQSARHLSGKDKGIELASIGRRACEMEYEAMRLIEEFEGNREG